MHCLMYAVLKHAVSKEQQLILLQEGTDMTLFLMA